MRLADMKKKLKAAAKKDLKHIADQILAEMLNEIPVDTGELMASVKQYWKGDYQVTIGSPLKQMYFVNYGNKPKDGGQIKAKRGKYMWFESSKTYNLPQKDGMYYAETVNPYKGKNFIEEIAKKYRSRYGG